MKKNLTINKYFLLLFSLLTISCSSDEEDIPIQIVEPSTYDFLRDGQSTVSFSGQTTRLNQADAIYNALNSKADDGSGVKSFTLKRKLTKCLLMVQGLFPHY